ncbi:unnamed protein product, partial [Mesorhabditis spiculigera]
MYDEMTLEFIRVLDAYDYKLFANRGGLKKLRDDIREQLKKKMAMYSTVGTEIAIEFLKASRDKNHVPESRNCSYEYFKSFCLAGNDKGCEKQLEQVGVEEEEIIYGTAIQLSFEAWRRNYPLPAFYGDKPLATIVFRELTIGDMFFAAWAVQKCDSYTRTLPSKESWGMRTLIDAASANHPYWIEQCGERDYMQRVERCPLLLPMEYHVDL